MSNPLHAAIQRARKQLPMTPPWGGLMIYRSLPQIKIAYPMQNMISGSR